MKSIAALYVETDGTYFGLTGVDPWDEPRDAREYAGPHPVVAHPPCQAWGRFATSHPIKGANYRKGGEDGGCFGMALSCIRMFGGILEHPAHSKAWPEFGLAKPPHSGGWVTADGWGYTCHVEQGHYGHFSRKPTWLYAVRTERPELRWGPAPPAYYTSRTQWPGVG